MQTSNREKVLTRQRESIREEWMGTTTLKTAMLFIVGHRVNFFFFIPASSLVGYKMSYARTKQKRCVSI